MHSVPMATFGPASTNWPNCRNCGHIQDENFINIRPLFVRYVRRMAFSVRTRLRQTVKFDVE